jgi:uncharacterized delta-60 repeat protein
MADPDDPMPRNVLAAALVLVLLRSAGVSQAIDCCGLKQPARQSDGGVITGGVTVGGTSYFGVSRTTPGGDPDLAFGDDGVTAPIEDLPSTQAVAVAVLPDDRIIAVGMLVTGSFSLSGFVVVRYDANGSLDEEFGEGGVGVSAIFEGPNDFAGLALRPAGGVVVASSGEVGPDEPRYVLASFDAQGDPDATFGDPIVDFGVLRDLDVQPDDRILVTLGGPAFFDSGRIVRWDPDGIPDDQFGGDGEVAPDLGPEDDVFHALLVQPDGRLVVVGAAGYERGALSDVLSNLAVFRLLPNGELDDDFGEGGMRITTLGGRFESLRDVVLQCDGSLLATGRSLSPSDEEEGVGPILIRYTSSGDVDDTYGVGGVASCEPLGSACTDPTRCASTTTTSSTSTTSTTSDGATTSTSSTVSTTSSTTTSTIDPGGGCATDCDDGDACTADACESAECRSVPLTGIVAVTCVCEQDTLDACRQEGIPVRFGNRADRACLALAKLPDATGTEARKILDKALRNWGAIATLLTKPKIVARVSVPCQETLATFQADAVARAQALRDEVSRRPRRR